MRAHAKRYRCPVRSLLVISLLVLASTSFADRIVDVPTATRLRDDMARFEFLGVPGRDRSQAWLGIGVAKSFELELTAEKFDSNAYVGSFNVAYNYILPITDLTPGVSLGMKDVLNRTRDGRSAYVAWTQRYGNIGELNQNVPTEFTIGASSQPDGPFFVGLMVPLAEHLRLLAEHNGKRLTAGVEMRPIPNVGVRLLFRQDENLAGLWVSAKF